MRDMLNIMKNKLDQCSSAQAIYDITFQQPVNNVVKTIRCMANVSVDYENQVGSIDLESLDDELLYNQSIQYRDNKETIELLHEATDPLDTTSSAMMGDGTFNLLFVPGGHLYPINLEGYVEVCDDNEDENCKSYTLTPQRYRQIDGYLGSCLTVCMMSESMFKVSFIMNIRDEEGFCLTHTTESTIQMCGEKKQMNC